MASVRVWQKKQIQLGRLNVGQRSMFQIGTVAVAQVRNRVAAAQGPNDAPAKPLTRKYAIWKTRLGKGNRRNLMLTGDMLRNFQVRTVTEKQAKASVTGRSTTKTTTNKRGKLVGVENKLKAWINQKREPWMVLSRKNAAAVASAARAVLRAMAPGLLLERSLGKQK